MERIHRSLRRLNNGRFHLFHDAAPFLGRRGEHACPQNGGDLRPGFAVGVGQFLGPFVISVLLNRIQAGTVTWQNTWPLVFWYLISQIVGTVVGWRLVLWATWTMEVLGMQRLFQRIFDHLTEQSVAFHPTVSVVRWCRRPTN